MIRSASSVQSSYIEIDWCSSGAQPNPRLKRVSLAKKVWRVEDGHPWEVTGSAVRERIKEWALVASKEWFACGCAELISGVSPPKEYSSAMYFALFSMFFAGQGLVHTPQIELWLLKCLWATAETMMKRRRGESRCESRRVMPREIEKGKKKKRKKEINSHAFWKLSVRDWKTG